MKSRNNTRNKVFFNIFSEINCCSNDNINDNRSYIIDNSKT